jgi:hypothetical protein
VKLERVRPFDWLAGLAGVALLVVLALPWYDLADGSHSAFGQFTIVDLWLALTALLAIAIPIVTAARDSPALPVAITVIAESISWIAVLLALWRAIDQPAGPLEPTVMPWVGVLAALAVSVTVWRALSDERAPGLRPPPAARTMPSPPRGSDAQPTAEAT